MENIVDSSKIKILICCHKACDLPKDDIFLPIQVGAAISNVDLGIQRDDQINGVRCDNISDKNQSFCELTALYWAWKNIKTIYPNLKYIGLNHYRRFFSFDEKNMLSDFISRPLNSISNYQINHAKLENILKNGNVILSQKRDYPYSIDIDYMYHHISDDFIILQYVVHTLYPEYDDAFYEVLMRNNTLSPYNMNIMEWNLFDKYCKWLFDILEDCERRISISQYNPLQKRIFGYMAERLLNVFVYKNCKKVKLLNVYFYDDNTSVPRQNFLKKYIIKIRNKICGILFSHTREKMESLRQVCCNRMKLIGQKV